MRHDPPDEWVLHRRRVIGRRIAEARAAAGLTQENLAEATGIDRRSLQRYEVGETDPTVGRVLRISRAVDVPLADLVRE